MASRLHHNPAAANHLARTGNGGKVSSRALMARMASAVDGSDGDESHAAEVLRVELKLTRRQAEVLHWIAQGKTNDEIATVLSCSFFTVKAHTKEIFRRLGVHSRTGAAACAYRAHIRFLSTLVSPERAIPKKHRSR